MLQVETIGDAYMVVGGLPKPCDNHAQKVAHMAISMMEASEKVLSPVDKTPLKVLINRDRHEISCSRLEKEKRNRQKRCSFG